MFGDINKRLGHPKDEKKKSSNFSNMQRATHTLLLSALLCIEQDRYCTMMPH